MATSGSYDYSVTAAQIIQAALEDIEVLGNGETIDSNDQALCLQRLNFIIKQWQGRADMKAGLKVWTRQRITLLFAVGQQSYLIGPASTDARASTAVGHTTISAAEAAGQTTISITSNTDTTSYPGTTITMTASDFVGIELDDGTIQWTTISGTPGATMTIANALTGAAAAGNVVYWFTSRAQRFPDIEAIYLRSFDKTDTPIDLYRTVQDYELGVLDKYGAGSPTSALIEPLRITTRITFDSQPTDMTEYAVIVALYPAEDYDLTTNDIAFPQEFFAALEWELAFRVAPAFNRPWTKEREINRQQATLIAGQVNPENSTAYFMPGRD